MSGLDRAMSFGESNGSKDPRSKFNVESAYMVVTAERADDRHKKNEKKRDS